MLFYKFSISLKKRLKLKLKLLNKINLPALSTSLTILTKKQKKLKNYFDFYHSEILLMKRNKIRKIKNIPDNHRLKIIKSKKY